MVKRPLCACVPLAETAADVPVAPERRDEAQRRRFRIRPRLAMPGAPVEGGAQVVMLRVEPVQPLRLPGTHQFRLRPLGEGEIVVAVAGSPCRRLACLTQALQGEGADG